MELGDYLAVLRRRWLTVVLTAGLFMVLAGIVSASRAPVYEASVDFYVVGRGADGTLDYTAGLLAQDRARTYARLIGTRRVAEAIVADLHLSADPAAVSAQLDGRVSPDSVLVVATVRDSTPERAHAIATSLGEVLPTVVRQLEAAGQEPRQGDESSVGIVPLGPPPFPTNPSNVSLAALLVIGATVGFVAGLALALVHHRLDPVVRRPDDLAQMPASVVGVIQVRKRRDPSGESSGGDERFALVRLSLERLGADTKRMLITTCGPERRESARAVNSLARAHAEAGQTVKVVDVSEEVTDVIVFRSDDPTPRVAEDQLRPNPQAPLAELPGEDADVVLVYGPPLLTSVDGVLFASAVNSVLLVVHGGRSRKADVLEAAKLLTSLHVPVWLLFIEPHARWRPRWKAPGPQAIGGADGARSSVAAS